MLYITGRLVVLVLGLATDFEVLAALQNNLVLEAALSALKTEHDLLGGLSLLVEDGLGLATETRLLAVVTTLAYRSASGALRSTNDSEGEGGKVLRSYPERTRRPYQSCTG